MPINESLVWKSCLLTAGVASGAMALYHFALPYQFGWASDIKPNAPNVAWGALMVNFCFSVLLLLGSFLLTFCSSRWKQRDELAMAVVCSMALFWTLNLLYQLAFPCPCLCALLS